MNLPLLGAIACGVTVRAVYVISADFPLNDGGMFYTAIQDLQASHYALPQALSYNGGNLPFAYPPLGFYMAAAFSSLPGVSVMDSVRYLPLLFSCLTLAAFYRLAVTVLGSRTQAVLALWVFALLPRAFNWEIVGGGITRSPGFFFSLVALDLAFRALRANGGRRHVIGAGAATALALLAHIEMAWFVAVSVLLFAIAGGRSDIRPRIVRAGAILGLTLLVASPWWAIVLLRFGADPFLAAASTGGHSALSWLRLLGPSPADEPLFPVLAATALLGIGVSIARKDYMLAIWPLALYLADPRKAATSASVPLALLAAVAVSEGVALLLARSTPPQTAVEPPLWARGQRAFVYSLMGFAYASALLAPISPRSPLRALNPSTRDSIAWTAHNTDPRSRFVVVSGTQFWATDAVSEWFPALSGRVSVATPQGQEWVREPSFQGRVQEYVDLQACYDSGLLCLDAWRTRTASQFDYVVVASRDTVTPRRASWQTAQIALVVDLDESPAYSLVFRNSALSIYRWAGGTRAAPSSP